jgi:hypothetical protein
MILLLFLFSVAVLELILWRCTAASDLLAMMAKARNAGPNSRLNRLCYSYV